VLVELAGCVAAGRLLGVLLFTGARLMRRAPVKPDEAGERIWLIPTKVFTPLIAAVVGTDAVEELA
jgi:hypothetical protein